MASEHRLRIVLVAPRIAQNVGQIARTCTALGAELHLVKPFGFQLTESQLDRSSVGYWRDLQPKIYRDSVEFWQNFSSSSGPIYFATKGGNTPHSECEFQPKVTVIFGNEEEGVPNSFWDYEGLPPIVACRIPTFKVRCLNLGVSVAVIGFEVLRQWGIQSSFKQMQVDVNEA